MSLVATRMDLEGSHVKGNQPVSGRQAHMMSFLDKFLKDKIKKNKKQKRDAKEILYSTKRDRIQTQTKGST